MPSKSPDAFRTISEVADWLQTPAHVLRFWESKFSQVKPVKRAGGRRYYRPADMALIGGIKKLLHDDGMTIKGVQKILREHGIKHVAALSPPLDEELEGMIEPAAATPAPARQEEPDTGKVLDFANRPAREAPAEPAPPKAAKPAPPPPAAKDLFDAEDDEDENIFAGQSEAPEPDAVAPESEPEPEQAITAPDPEPAAPQSHEDLPDFVQKPMAERLAEDQAEETADPADEDAPVAEEALEELAAAEPEPTPDPETLAADTAEADDSDAPRPAGVDTAADPLDHDLAVETGPLTYLTSAEMRAHRHSAEQIETLIIRVRGHHRALTHAARH